MMTRHFIPLIVLLISASLCSAETEYVLKMRVLEHTGENNIAGTGHQMEPLLSVPALQPFEGSELVLKPGISARADTIQDKNMAISWDKAGQPTQSHTAKEGYACSVTLEPGSEGNYTLNISMEYHRLGTPSFFFSEEDPTRILLQPNMRRFETTTSVIIQTGRWFFFPFPGAAIYSHQPYAISHYTLTLALFLEKKSD